MGAEWAADGVFTLFAILFFFIGAQFLAFGLLGEYIGRIYQEVRDRPTYLLRDEESRRPHRRKVIMQKRVVPALLALFAVAYLAPLGMRPLFQPDEFRYAEIPREMLAGGDWIVPRLDGMRYFEKPVLGYWLTAASMAVFGENPFAARLPVALVGRRHRPGGLPAGPAVRRRHRSRRRPRRACC